MPVSAEMTREKTKSKSEILCDRMDDLIAKSKKELAVFDKIKQEMDFEPGLLKKAVEMKLGSENDIKQVMTEMKEWKTEVKSEVKAAVMGKKQELKLERKNRRKNQKGQPKKATAHKKKKSRGGYI